MNIIAFTTSGVNIFPLANSQAGGQLASEFNLRARETVLTDSSVEYVIGPSYTHSLNDFSVYSQKDGYDTTISSTVLQIEPGRALVNGHFVQSLTPVNIDLNDVNALCAKEGLPALKGKLAIGLRMAYSTYTTLAETAKIENEDGYYEGLQVVILPQKDVKLPKDVPAENEYNKVNMNLLLGTFTFRNGSVSNVKQNEDKIKCIEASRISDLAGAIDEGYITSKNLDPNKLYVFAGKSSDGSNLSGKSTWCDATDSLFLLDRNPKIGLSTPSNESTFRYNSDNGNVEFVAAHKQVDGMKNLSGQDVYFQDKIFTLPAANFDTSTGGVVDKAYTDKIKQLKDKVDTYYELGHGHMKAYIAELTDRSQLPTIPVGSNDPYYTTTEKYFSDLNDIKTSLSNLEATVSTLHTTINTEVTTQLTSMQTTIDSSVDQKISSLNTTLNSDISDVNAEITNLSSNIDSLTERIVTLEGYHSGGSGTGTSGDLTQAKKDIQALQSSVRSLQTTTTKLSDDITQYSSEALSQIKLATQTYDNKYQKYVSDMDTKFAALKSQIQAQFAATKTEYTNLITNLVAAIATKYNITDEYTWRPGDYILVGRDNTLETSGEASDIDTPPSTMYVVVAPYITTITYVDKISMDLYVKDTGTTTYLEAYKKMLHTVPDTLAGGVCVASQISSIGSDDTGNTVTTDQMMESFGSLSTYRGTPGKDYFVYRLSQVDSTNFNVQHWTSYFFTPVLTETHYSYSDPVRITGGVPVATTDSVGGFLSVNDDTYGQGYVRVDETGHLRVVDYELLLTGVLSYQLGQDYTEGSNITLTDLQTILDDNINSRVAWPNATQISNAAKESRDPYIIHIYLVLPNESGTLKLHDIGSRYDTVVYLHLQGSATSNLTVEISHCDKLRIDSNIAGAPTIILNDVNLYYDAEVLNYISTISNLKLWYHKYESNDPDLQVDGMTVTSLGQFESTSNLDPWSSNYANDNHYSYALRDVTFADDGSIIKIGMIVGDSTTANVEEGKSVFASTFTVPQSVGINYPLSKMLHRIKVTGTFVSHYYIPGDTQYMMKVTNFTAITQKYNPLTTNILIDGTISFLTDAFLVDNIVGIDPESTVDGWDLNTPHYFEGGMIE